MSTNYPHYVALKCTRVTYGKILLNMQPLMSDELQIEHYSTGWHDYEMENFNGVSFQFKHREDAMAFVLAYGGEYRELEVLDNRV